MDVEYELLLRSHGPERARELLSQRYSIHGDQKPILVLHSSEAGSKNKATKRKQKKKSRSSQLLSEFVATSSSQYETYIPLNHLWNSYIEHVMRGDSGIQRATALLSADWHGALVEVGAAKVPSYVGIRGILLWETRSTVVIVTTNNQMRQVQKRGCLFQFENLGLSVLGSRVLCRSSERTTRKFKPHNVSDVYPLLKI